VGLELESLSGLQLIGDLVGLELASLSGLQLILVVQWILS
jgi:hypothetical protein